MDETIDKKNLIVMKLLHYFITEKDYNPIILQGAENEIWLENMDSDYKIVRIVSHHIHNKEQLEYDLFKTKHVVSKIKRKTFSFHMNVLSIFTDIREEELALVSPKNYDCIYLKDEKDIKNYQFVTERFPDICKKLKFGEEGMQLFLKITSDINRKNKKDQVEANDVFQPKNPIITKILIAINVVIFLAMMFGDANRFIYEYAVYRPFIVEYHQYYRLITGTFLHANVFHLLFNCYALFVIGSQVESFMGKARYLMIYLFSALGGSLLSIVLNSSASVGASGAVFGLMGSLLYFGYHYRVYLGSVIRSQIIPLILINLCIGFLSGGQIDNFAHIGGLVGGFLISIAVGVKYKSSKFEMVNGWIVSILLVAFLLILANRIA